MSATDFLVWLQSFRSGLLDGFFALATFIGSEEFLLGFLALVYWCYNRTMGLRLAIVFLASQYINGVLKTLTNVTRPGPPVSLLNEETTLGTSSWPSGHAQNAAGTFGTMAALVKRTSVVIVLLFTIFLVGLSRMYLGLHWPLDVVSGWATGGVVALAGVVLFNRFSQLDARHIGVAPLAGLLALPLVLLVLNLSDTNAKAAGAAMGLILGWWLERRTVGFEAQATWVQQVIKAAVGLAVVFGLRVLLKPVLEVLPIGYLPDVLRYFALGLWVAWVAPMIFVRLFGRASLVRAQEAEAIS